MIYRVEWKRNDDDLQLPREGGLYEISDLCEVYKVEAELYDVETGERRGRIYEDGVWVPV